MNRDESLGKRNAALRKSFGLVRGQARVALVVVALGREKSSQ